MIFFWGGAIFQSSRYVPECGGYALGEAKWVCGEDRVDISRFPLSCKLSDRPVSFRCPGEHRRQTFRSSHSEAGTKICIARGSCSLCLSSFFLFFASHISDSLTWQSSWIRAPSWLLCIFLSQKCCLCSHLEKMNVNSTKDQVRA